MCYTASEQDALADLPNEFGCWSRIYKPYWLLSVDLLLFTIRQFDIRCFLFLKIQGYSLPYSRILGGMKTSGMTRLVIGGGLVMIATLALRSCIYVLNLRGYRLALQNHSLLTPNQPSTTLAMADVSSFSVWLIIIRFFVFRRIAAFAHH